MAPELERDFALIEFGSNDCPLSRKATQHTFLSSLSSPFRVRFNDMNKIFHSWTLGLTECLILFEQICKK
jgi:hypothetical protein